MEDYEGRGKARGRLLPMVAIPTTAGTGSETQSFALIAREESHAKMACGDPRAAPCLAVLDPTLTTSMPRAVTACTGLDALGHAVETAVTRPRNPASTLFSTESFKLIQTEFPRVLAEPADLYARGRMLLAASWAGLAIENSMLGAAHSMANPLSAHHGLEHGLAVGLMLPRVVRHNAEDAAARAGYAGLALAAGLVARGAPDTEAIDALVRRIEELLELCDLGCTLREHGVTESNVETLAAEASMQWTAQFNPRKLETEDFAKLLESALGPIATASENRDD